MREGLEGKIMLVVNPQAPEALKSLTCYQISAGRYLLSFLQRSQRAMRFYVSSRINQTRKGSSEQ